MKRKEILVLLLIFLLSPALATGNTLRNIGFNFYWDGDFVEMVGNFKRTEDIVRLPMRRIGEKHWTLVIRLRPGFYHYRYLLGGEHWRLDPFIEDVIEVEEGPIQGRFTLLKVFPLEYENYITLAGEYSEEGRLRWAEDVLSQAAKEFPGKEEVYMRLGEINEELGSLDLAADAYRKGKERHPENYEFHYRLALVYEKMYENTSSKDFNSKARELWMELLEAGQYTRQSRQRLR